MKRIITLIIGFVILFSLVACNTNNTTTPDAPSTVPSKNTDPTTDTKEKDNMKILELKIGDTIVAVTWEDNASVNALKEPAKDGLTLSMHEYGGFEQTGMLGSTITSNDSRIDVVPGDIVLYNSNQISIFYNSSSWSYTKLGHINLGENELRDLLISDMITVIISFK